jgi:hypothetical protein
MHVASTRVAAVTWFQQLIAKMERQADKKLVTVITDNAPEFISCTFQQFLGGLGIEHLYSVPHETTHNGPVERVIRTLVSMTRKLLADGALPVRLWPHAARHAAYLFNRLAHGGLDSQLSPFTALCGVLPRYHYLRPFGSLAFFSKHFLARTNSHLDRLTWVSISALVLLPKLTYTGIRLVIASSHQSAHGIYPRPTMPILIVTTPHLRRLDRLLLLRCLTW